MAEIGKLKCFLPLEILTANPFADTLPGHSNGSFEQVKVLVIGSRYGVTLTINTLHVLRFADVGQWSRLLPAPTPGEVMSILIRRIASPTV
ncbi:MAG TPA: hypothetical protein DCY88_05975 [Cyanobacteria bacterium UBA11372]|nr:hypothetical protein [Cyanobacteria bacterium UBA11372]